jgi:hypothetical protein
MQFRTLLLLAALVTVVAAEGYNKDSSSSSGYGKDSSSTSGYSGSSSSSTSGYSGSSSSSSGYSDDSSSSVGYGEPGYKKKFAAPPFWVRWGKKLHHIKEKIKNKLKCIAHDFHQAWINFKSDAERLAFWFKCEKTHFKHWWQYKCDVAAGKKKIRSALQQKYYDALCKLEKDEKDKYKSRVAECKDTKDDYTEEDDDYVQSTTCDEYKVEKVEDPYGKKADKGKY